MVASSTFLLDRRFSPKTCQLACSLSPYSSRSERLLIPIYSAGNSAGNNNNNRQQATEATATGNRPGSLTKGVPNAQITLIRGKSSQRNTSKYCFFIPLLPFDVELDHPPRSSRPNRLSSQHAHSLLANSCSLSYFLVRRPFVTVDHYYVLQFRRTHNGHTQF
jgi:hypothetical protein